jgi:hypothetical protein
MRPEELSDGKTNITCLSITEQKSVSILGSFDITIKLHISLLNFVNITVYSIVCH